MHSATEAPPLGEPIAAVYSRMASFYERVCAPLAERGSNVLVVSHQYALEPLALYLAGEPPENYRNVNLPNGKALSPEDLAAAMRAERGGGWRQRMQHFGDRCVLASAYVAPAALLRPFMMKFLTTALAPSTALFDAGALLVNRRGERFGDRQANSF